MAKPSPKKPGTLEDIELHSDAWERFEKFVDTKVRTSATPIKKPTTSRPKTASRKPRAKG